MEVFRYWIGASPEAPVEQIRDVDILRKTFRVLDQDAVVEQYGDVGGMVLLRVETQEPLSLDFQIPATVVAFEHRQVLS